MSVQLLDKTRKINKLLHNNHSSKVLFNDICEVMVETLDSNILVISKKGKVLGVGTCQGVQEITELIDDEVGGFIDKLLNERLLGVLSTKENVTLYLLPEKRRLAAVTVAFPLQLTLQKFDDGFLHLLRRCVLRKVFFQLACVDFQGFFLVALFLRHNRKYRIHVKPPALA